MAVSLSQNYVSLAPLPGGVHDKMLYVWLLFIVKLLMYLDIAITQPSQQVTAPVT